MTKFPTIFEAKEQILEIGKRMYQKGFVAANDGNISCKIAPDVILTTPTGVSKGFMDQDMIVRDRSLQPRYPPGTAGAHSKLAGRRGAGSPQGCARLLYAGRPSAYRQSAVRSDFGSGGKALAASSSLYEKFHAWRIADERVGTAYHRSGAAGHGRNGRRKRGSEHHV